MTTSNVPESLRVLKASVESLVKTRLDRIEAEFHRALAQLEQRVSKIEQEMTLAAHDRDLREDATVGMADAIETRLAQLEQQLANRKPAKLTKRVERDANQLITKIIEE